MCVFTYAPASNRAARANRKISACVRMRVKLRVYVRVYVCSGITEPLSPVEDLGDCFKIDFSGFAVLLPGAGVGLAVVVLV